MKILSSSESSVKAIAQVNALITIVTLKQGRVSFVRDDEVSVFKKPKGFNAAGSPEWLMIITKENRIVDVVNQTYKCEVKSKEDGDKMEVFEIKADNGNAYDKLNTIYNSITPTKASEDEAAEVRAGDHIYKLTSPYISTLMVIPHQLNLAKLIEIVNQAIKQAK